MRRLIGLLALVLLLSTALTGCGAKDASDVVGDLKDKMKDLGSYEGNGKMVLKTGDTAQEYNVEVWYQKPHYYRIALTNTQRDVTQIVLRNDEGVFVLTPHLKKSFRFQSDWPESQGQVYLFQSLAKSIIEDSSRVFAAENGDYVFDVAANYQNKSLARQKIWLGDDLRPKKVQVMDSNQAVVVEVTFDSFKFGSDFEKDSFDTQRNLTSYDLKSLPTVAGADNKAGAKKEFGVIQPVYSPDGVKLAGIDQVKRGDNDAIVLRYKGTFNYTIIEQRPKEVSASAREGKPVDLGFTIGVLTGVDNQTLSWTYDGVEYNLATADLPETEMIQIAQSTLGQVGK